MEKYSDPINYGAYALIAVGILLAVLRRAKHRRNDRQRELV